MYDGNTVRCLYSKTEEELKVDAKTLPRESLTRVYVECDRCNETFIRRFCDLDKPHACPGMFGRVTKPPVRLEYKRIHPDAKAPNQSRPTDAGHDVYSVEDKTIKSFEMTALHTGVCIACPPGWYYTVEGRSGLYQKRIVPNRGIIDATYCGELIIVLSNWSETPYEVKKGDRIAQIILHKAYSFDMIEVSEFGPEYNQRGVAGFGSTGR